MLVVVARVFNGGESWLVESLVVVMVHGNKLDVIVSEEVVPLAGVVSERVMEYEV